MGTYKVPQNVEAEDKILGPLSLRQFIYVVIGLAYGGLMFAIFRQFIAGFIILGLPPMLFMLVLGVGKRADQTFESYFFAVIKYYVTPRVRFWEKEPIFEVFKIEIPPPKPEEIRRDPREVRGQLEKLADIVDTRGWATKEPVIQDRGEVAVVDMGDRIGGQTMNSPVFAVATHDITAGDDILDAANNANAQNLNVLIENSAKSVREEALAMMSGLPQPPAANPRSAVAMPSKTALSATQAPQTNMNAPTASTPPQNSNPARATGVTPDTANAIIKLATEGGEMSISALAAQAAVLVQHNQELLEGKAVTIRNANTASA